MKLISAFLQLVRWPNLIFIALTQVLFEYCIYERIYGPGNTAQLIFIILASVCIAAAGNVINDYFDLNIDQVNKPNKVVVNTVINRRWVIFWHMFLSMSGLYFTAYAFPLAQYWHLVLANMASILLLWFYSTNFKKQLLVGNVIIALLTAWVILVLFFARHPMQGNIFSSAEHNEVRFFRLAILYAGFAFVISLIREVVKDVEDMEGDRRYGCNTMPIAWGVNAARLFVATWIIVLIGVLVILQLYVLPMGWWHLALYSLVTIIAPLVWVLRKLFTATTPAHFHKLSTVIKFVMLTGILSMLFFRLYD